MQGPQQPQNLVNIVRTTSTKHILPTPEKKDLSAQQGSNILSVPSCQNCSYASPTEFDLCGEQFYSCKYSPTNNRASHCCNEHPNAEKVTINEKIALYS